MINILIADDNDSNIYVLEMLIEEWFDENCTLEYKLDSATNGAEVLDCVKDNTYDIIFLDIMMPVMNGFEALEKLNEMNLKSRPCIIVASAIIDDSKNKNIAKELKANAFIVKPLSYETISVMLSKYIKKDLASNKQDTKMYTYFDNHKILTAKELLKDYPYNIVEEDSIQDLEHLITDLNIERNSLSDIHSQIEIFNQILNKARLMLISISELDSVISSFDRLNVILSRQSLLSNYEDEISSSIVSISENLVVWFEDVFLSKRSENIYEIVDIVDNEIVKLENL